MSGLKRKRDSEGVSTPKKRPATSLKHDAVKISWIKTGKNDLPPVLAVATGLSAPNIALNAYTKETSRQLELILHSSAHSRLDYIAKEEFGGGSDALLQHYIGVYDPETGELKLTEARKVALRSTLRPTKDELDRAMEEKTKLTKLALRATLGMEFGTRKAKKRILSETENAVIQGEDASDLSIVKNDAIQQAFLESIKETAGDMPTREDMAAAIEDSKPKPKANLEATHPALVYPIERLVGVQILHSTSVDDWLKKVKNQEGVTTRSRYVSKRLQSVAQSGDLSKLKVLRYMLMLIDFFHLLKTSGGSKTKAKKMPKLEVVKEKLDVSNHLVGTIIARFTVKGEVTKWQSDYIITHVCAMSLYVEEYSTDTNDLREDFRLEQKQISNYFRELGCKIAPVTIQEQENLRLTKAEAKTHKMAKLKIPLEFPEPQIGPRRSGQGRR